MRLIDAEKLNETIPNTNADLFENCRNCKLLSNEEVRALIDDAPTVDAVPIVHLADLLERWNWDCAMCTHYVDCDKCNLNRCIHELNEIINSITRKKGEHGATD